MSTPLLTWLMGEFGDQQFIYFQFRRDGDLMHHPAQEPPCAAPPWGLIGMIALIVAAEGAVGRWHPETCHGVRHDWRLSRHAAEGGAARCEVLCFGDSIMKQAAQPPVLSPGLKCSAYNLAVFSGQAPTSYFLLRRALAAGARPRAIVVNFCPFLMQQGTEVNDDKWPSLLNFSEAVELSWSTRRPALLAQWISRTVLRSVARREAIRDDVLTRLRGQVCNLSEAGEVIELNSRRNGGAVVRPPNPMFPLHPEQFHAWYIPPAWVIQPVQADYLRRFLDLAAARNIPVFWVLPPYSPLIQDYLDQHQVEVGYLKGIRGCLDRYPNLTVLDGRYSGYAPSVFWDAEHLDGHGGSIFSADLAQVIGPRLSGAEGPRWIALPKFRDRPIPHEPENTDQTRFALTNTAALRR